MSLVWAAIPQPSELTLHGGAWAPRSVRVVAESAEFEREAERLRVELGVLRVHGAHGEDAAVASLVLRGSDDTTLGREGFELEISEGDVVLRARTAAGAFRGTRQLLHNLRAQGCVPAASIRSVPAVGERGLHIDAARKFYPAEWLEQLIIDAADIGVTTLQWHFSENEGLRLESARHPEIVSDEHITRDEAQRLIAVARDRHIEVIPSLDMPGHLRHVLARHPDLQLPAEDSGLDTTHALNITDPRAVDFALDLIDDYAELFAESRHWNLGGDEFVDFDRIHEYPVLAATARERFGPRGSGFDLLTEFVNTIANHLIERGFVPRVWNDGMLRSSHVTLDERVQFAWWTNWNVGMRPVREALARGHSVVNVNDAMFYYVLGEQAGYRYPTSERIWAADWHPGMFPMRHVSLPDRVQELTQPYPEQLLGTSFAIWSDTPGAQTCPQVADGIRSPLRAFAERSWNAGSALSHDEFAAISEPGAPPESLRRGTAEPAALRRE
ncbi:family 20 glycosylhydrolase [Paramicrobacterium sp. CJ85]|uniref:family 20 glycosylhydrolase n=1 Tax=Paramicrobacterium sp. CJ85 TaxID=3445355 RepID=UPI003F637DB9